MDEFAEQCKRDKEEQEMFNLVENNFLQTGVCKYEDGNGNTLTMRRQESGFTAKLRFADKRIQADIFRVECPVRERDGDMLNLTFEKGSGLCVDDVRGVTTAFGEIVKRWISLTDAIAKQELSDEMMVRFHPEYTKEDVVLWKFRLLEQFEELKPLTNAVLCGA